MTQTQDLKRPLSPSQLFQRLMQGNFKQIQCIDEAAHVKQQKSILISLISQYRQEIDKRMELFQKLQKIVEIRNRLRLQLQSLREQRIVIDRNIQFQTQKHKLNPIEIADISSRKVEIEQMRVKNAGLEGRLRQLAQYCLKMEKHNIILQKENRVVHQFDIRQRSTSDLGYGCGDYCNCANGGLNKACGWRERLSAIKLHQQNITKQMHLRMRQQQQNNCRIVRLKQQEIAERNRRRMASFQERFKHSF